MSKLIIRGAREHNLKNIDVDLPLERLIVITGLSGSGKSSLAFDTIYAEGQRRYIESLSAYARQFLGMMNKPDVESIHGLSPAISIEQKSVSKNPRSTVGTITEISDYLRLLYARIGIVHCPQCHRQIGSQSPEMIVDAILAYDEGSKIQILAPLIRGKKGTYEALFANLQKQGYARVRIDGILYDITEVPRLDKQKKHTIDVVIDRIKVASDMRSRVAEAVEVGMKLAEGFIIVICDDHETLYSQYNACTDCNINFEELQPRSFSFNSPFGACDQCHGLGVTQEFDIDLIIPDKKISILDGAILPWKTQVMGYRGQMIHSLARAYNFNPNMPVQDLPKDILDIILHGTKEKVDFNVKFAKSGSRFRYSGKFEGVMPQLARYMRETESDSRREQIRQYMLDKPCPSCEGKRLKKESLAVRIGNKNIFEVGEYPINELSAFIKNLSLGVEHKKIAKSILREITSRLRFLENVGLSYLTLNRSSATLSGGESQRIRLATQIGSELRGVLYVLDEPSIGLHQRDNDRLIDALKKLRDLGNTLIVVEHDAETILQADHVLDVGPGAGVHGGYIVAQGTPQEIMKNKKSLTGRYLCGDKEIPVPLTRRTFKKNITISGAREHNLKDVTVSFPLGVLTCVTGVSGSGKSTLINETLSKVLTQKINKARVRPGQHDAISGTEYVDKVINIDQSPIGRTPRSNPATYIKVFDLIRDIFSQTTDARVRGYKQGRFSFNVKGGRCEHCAGDGLIKVEMHFLPDVFVQCEKCKGARYNKETLEIRYKDKTIADVLDMTVEEALDFFKNIPRIERKLKTLCEVGLGYIKMGQSATTLSGGEAQRIKLTLELAKRDTGNTLYILDEPTTGLHFDDVAKLIEVLQRLVDKGNSVLVIEHNLDMIKVADHIIDMGPEGGDAGGMVIAEGTPEKVATITASHTGRYLKKILRES